MDFRNKDNTYEHKLVVLDFLSKPQGNQVQLIYVLVHPFFRGLLCTRQQQLENTTVLMYVS